MAPQFLHCNVGPLAHLGGQGYFNSTRGSKFISFQHSQEDENLCMCREEGGEQIGQGNEKRKEEGEKEVAEGKIDRARGLCICALGAPGTQRVPPADLHSDPLHPQGLCASLSPSCPCLARDRITRPESTCCQVPTSCGSGWWVVLSMAPTRTLKVGGPAMFRF